MEREREREGGRGGGEGGRGERGEMNETDYDSTHLHVVLIKLYTLIKRQLIGLLCVCCLPPAPHQLMWP